MPHYKEMFALVMLSELPVEGQEKARERPKASSSLRLLEKQILFLQVGSLFYHDNSEANERGTT